MKTKIKTVTHYGKEYKVLNGTYYHKDTPNVIVELLEHIQKNQIRVRFHWGDIKTGKDWGEIHDVQGRIGRSMGPVKIPILLYNRRSLGGSGILTHCIVKIVKTQGQYLLYQHPKYHC